MSSKQVNEFYVTLPSNASINIFSANKTSSFTTKLVSPIHLTGNWIVGLSSLSIPWSFYNIPQEENVVLQNDDIQYDIKLSPGYYDSVESIINIINEDQKLTQQEQKEEEMGKVNNVLFSFQVDSSRNQVGIRYKQEQNKYYVIAMTGHIQTMLGFSKNPNIKTQGIHFNSPNDKKKLRHINVHASYPHNMDFCLPSEINVCLDIVKEQPVYGKLLRKVSVYEYQYGKMKFINFNRPHYVKVEKKYFDTLHVDLKDLHAQNLPFQFGTSNLTLHFKQQ
jgi:hypothetical protein